MSESSAFPLRSSRTTAIGQFSSSFVEVLQPAPTTQEGVDGFCETGMRVAGVEQAESDTIMDMSTSGELPKWARQSSTSGGVSPNQEKRFVSPTRENS